VRRAQLVDWRGPSGPPDVAAAFGHFAAQGNAASAGQPYWRQAGAVSLASPSCPARPSPPGEEITDRSSLVGAWPTPGTLQGHARYREATEHLLARGLSVRDQIFALVGNRPFSADTP